MKSKLSSVLFSTLLAASALLAVQVRAEDGPGGPPPGGPNPGGEHRKGGEKAKMPDPAERIEKMKEHLGLSDAQAKQLKEIFGAEMKEMQALRKDESVPVEQKREKAKAIREATKAKVDAVLTPEQLAKAEAARNKMADRKEGKEKKRGLKDPKGEKPAPPEAE
jgi:Spy/CpxP family protein refolding chaperone